MSDCKRGFATTCRWFTALALSALLAACGGGSSGGNGGTGTLGVSLTDAPACGFDAVNVTVNKVRVHQSGAAAESAGGWSEITLSPARKINLLDLTNGVLEGLGETALPAGHYTQLRLVLAANNGPGPLNNSVVSSSAPGIEVALVTPSAVQSGIKLIHEFDVAAGQRVDLVLDFDACKSVVRRGNGRYLLKPVIKVIPTARNGIGGVVDASLLGSHVVLSAQMAGTAVRSTVPDTSTGAFFLTRLAPGNYDVVITADNHATAVIGAVPVADSTGIVILSDEVAPISLPDSATRTLSGNATLSQPSATEEVMVVAAKQTIGSGPTVTVKSQAVNPDPVSLSAPYSLTLPVAAPLLGQYVAGETPPIPLTAQTAPAGQYNVEAAATGYQTQSFSKTISAADATQDFTLVP